MFNQKKIDSIAEREATIECFNITLTQNTPNSPLIFNGPGCLFFDENKTLKVKIYSTSTKSDSIEMMNFLWNNHIGIVPEERYFTLEAEDTSGKTWKNTRVLAERGVDTYPSGAVLELALNNARSFSQLKHSVAGGSALIAVNGNYRLPFNEFINNGKGSKELAKLSLSQGTKTVEIVQKGNKLDINVVDSKDPVELDSLFYLLEGVSIAIGQLLEASFIIARNGIAYEAYIQGEATENTYTLAEPIVEIFPSRETGLDNFLQMYMKARPKGLNHLANYWHRLKDISKANTEAAALVLCVNIEGMVKNYFSTSIDLDEKTLKEISDTREFIKTSGSKIPKIGADAILNFLGGLKTKTVSAILSDMSASGEVDKAHVKSWKDLRHTLAHADNAVISSDNFEKFVFDLQNCLALFGKLIELCVTHFSNDSVMTALALEAQETLD
ncbi:hypothetical protein SAMN04489802_2099 [Pseudomonas chlororaphis]|uniref:hypothetical protein n=1 Tax=Pseudomonas chlororaphis TaxID=587753 RepID=UPI000879E2CE|nr:hypothetical protein [Pseudomonas chlororaphis]AZD68302.1 hypothetical protein C4K17_4424 [Pseudomonas chlororaphis subsp. aurantiaca]QIT24204.1 hypothetical protein HCN09_21660 [Pseudomonas chlororaphis subsp. aurantiaca]WDH02315.1 hypothetical protein PUP57_22790 [Pseudomonas chlororaphis]WDH08837.1 hypothetical protein PUP64_24220 [Pseudomonas chlororaphis]SDS71926.1 hypothetical protein SAMN04489802_2099 [Pseudomonas chlororaphis]